MLTVIPWLLVVLPIAFAQQQASLIIYSDTKLSLHVEYRNSECDRCSLRPLADIQPSKNTTVHADTFYPSYCLFVKNRATGKNYCPELESSPFTFGENGTYLLSIMRGDKNSSEVVCSFSTIIEPASIFMPIYIAVGALIGAGLLYALAKLVYKRYLLTGEDTRNELTKDLGNLPQPSTSTYSLSEENRQSQLQQQQHLQADEVKATASRIRKISRMKSVDVLRGICLAIMIFVNYGAGGYSLLDHTPWNGLHLADTVFPGFIFIMGISLPLSFKSLGNKPAMRHPDGSFHLGRLMYKITKRSILLFFFGLVTSNTSEIFLANLRIMGVLQRFAITYMITALVELIYFRSNNFAYVDHAGFEINWPASKFSLIKSYAKEILYYPLQWVIMALIATVWVLFTYFLPVEGCPTGYIGPGGLHLNSNYLNCTGGAAGLIDRLILGENHIYQTPTSQAVYLSRMPYDPEGLLGCLTSVVLCYLGVQCGHIIIHYQQARSRLVRFAAYACIYGAIALSLSSFSKNDGVMPINKNLWSLSFILLVASMSYLSLCLLYPLVDLLDFYSGTPFLYLGRNSITIYISHIVFANYFPLFAVSNSHASMLAKNLYGVALWCLVAAIMNHYKVFINL